MCNSLAMKVSQRVFAGERLAPEHSGSRGVECGQQILDWTMEQEFRKNFIVLLLREMTFCIIMLASVIYPH